MDLGVERLCRSAVHTVDDLVTVENRCKRLSNVRVVARRQLAVHDVVQQEAAINRGHRHAAFAFELCDVLSSESARRDVDLAR